jgi:hypothetical protein
MMDEFPVVTPTNPMQAPHGVTASGLRCGLLGHPAPR